MKKDQPQVDDFPKLSNAARRALAGAGIHSLKELTKFSEKEIKQLHGISPNPMKQLHHALAANGWSFANKKKDKTR